MHALITITFCFTTTIQNTFMIDWQLTFRQEILEKSLFVSIVLSRLWKTNLVCKVYMQLTIAKILLLSATLYYPGQAITHDYTLIQLSVVLLLLIMLLVSEPLWCHSNGLWQLVYTLRKLCQKSSFYFLRLNEIIEWVDDITDPTLWLSSFNNLFIFSDDAVRSQPNSCSC